MPGLAGATQQWHVSKPELFIIRERVFVILTSVHTYLMTFEAFILF